MTTNLSKNAADNAGPNTPDKPVLRRSDVARMLGISISSVRRFEWTGVLHPKRVGKVWYFDIDEVQELPVRKPRPKKIQRQSAGQIAAAAFRRFAAGYDLRQIVEDLKVDPEEVERLYAHYERNNVRAHLDLEHQAKLERVRRSPLSFER